MKIVKETKRTRQLEIYSETGELVQRVCRTCQLVKLPEDFPKYTQGYLRPDCHECHKKKQRKYISETADQRTVYKQRERARKVGAPDNYTLEDFLELKAFANGRCMISGKETDLQIDHIQALSKGWLGSTKGNIILVSEEVNQAKRDLSIFEFLKSERSKGLVDKEQLMKTFRYLAEANNMTMAQYIEFLEGMEELAERAKTFRG
ncbi:hypothetical protein CG478_000915 [Bacillus cytotoxicus]|uniref:hypothetical protein n=1 Tax=Bacillus cytotoxicus TaxID=580165 RepID=UPI000B978464|nr:hypothetical protein [Bacillus cytotoxicus]AWC27134.1 hypothetical protein CG483_000915 [Bacillus cytotoxicus]AWC39248.1 hypothetical protein CG480_000915 [Bacillus cytotoxicus]AWC47179.1 hypothetical protein CG478_000915 [Bacillus cytotoxicus]AWC51200.1 hypothetical protein CG477_000915 [Bacillus cytotoxicus]AWC55329.1 hypothetical protein CG476_000915 [Bacillus cytotoxicus]